MQSDGEEPANQIPTSVAGPAGRMGSCALCGLGHHPDTACLEHHVNIAYAGPYAGGAPEHGNVRENTAAHEPAPPAVHRGTSLSEADVEEPDRKVVYQTVFNITNNFTGPISKIVINQA
ncbi:hypothetical protein AURDEDRAFT_120874 [Auricularia subglabra TFB-10046 SS5]|nr:hypothetical protein AURDEDRAFT_120874 [Auricularia subglabra TFB-10046 SS5]